MTSSDALSNLLHEERRFPPSDEFAAQANTGPELYDEAKADRLAFWEHQARDLLSWDQQWTQVLDWSNAPFARWFVGGRLNVAYNCVDRHVEAGHGDQVAIHWEGEPGDSRDITYAELQAEVCRTANALTELGVGHGDRVAIYLPMLPEAAIAMLACARLGAIHSVVFGGFSAEALRSRIEDAEAKVVVTADGGYRRGKTGPLKPAVDEAIAQTPSIRHVLVVRRTGQEVPWTEGRDVWWHDVVARQPDTHAYEAHDAEDTLFILYTSGTTGKPKGIKHTTGGYLLQNAYTHKYVFDLKPDTDVFWCTADIGWVTGHSYIVYGPLANRATQVMYEGTPDTPHTGRFWEIVDKYKVSILYTAPTLIRTMMKWGDEVPARYDLSSLRLLGSVGEPINPEAWMWYRQHVGRDRCPIVDTYWSRFEDRYFAGDGAKLDEDGDIWLLGRVDDVMNVSGHRISTTEVESALVSHPIVAEAAVVGASDPTTGQGIVAFVILRGGGGDEDGDAVARELRAHVAKEIGPIAKPRQIMVVAELPKTRSGKIMRRLLRDVAENREIGDVTTLADSTVMDLIKGGLAAGPAADEA